MLQTNKYFFRILFIIIILFLVPALFAKTKILKNENIILAQKLIKEKKYNDASKLLLEELVNNPENEYKIMKLIEQIEKEKEKTVGMIEFAKESIKKGEYEQAEEVLSKLENCGDFDETINKLVETILTQKEPLKLINKFNNYVTNEAEKFIQDYNTTEAIKNYRSALDIYRGLSDTITNSNFKKAVAIFNSAETILFNTDINKSYIYDKNEIQYEEIKQDIEEMENTFKQWQKLENEFTYVKNILDSLDKNTKSLIVYEAYDSISEKYQYAVRRGIQKYSNGFKDLLFKLLENELKLIETGNIDRYNDFERTYSLLNKMEEYFFYKILQNYDKEYLIKRSKTNLVLYLDFVTKKNIYFIQYAHLKLEHYFNESEKYFTEYQNKKIKKEITESKEDLKIAENNLKNVLESKEEADSILKLYKEKDFEEYYRKNKMYSDKAVAFNKKINKAWEDINSIFAYADKVLKEADDAFNKSINYFNSKTFQKSRESFSESKDKYLDVLLVMKSDYVDKQIAKIDEYLDLIDQISFKEEMKSAEEHIEKAKTNFYAERYEDAKTDIDEADKIYTKYNQNMEIISYYRERILSALKIQSGKKLSIDDSAYEEIIELFKNAKISFEKDDYDKALEYITQILLEKPYYEDARLFEIKILQKKDIESFKKIFNNYFNRAKAKYDTNNYGEALIDFQQLLQFGINTNEIKSYINRCKLRLNLSKPTTNEDDRNKARALIKEAQNSYAKGNYQDAYNQVNSALRIWEDVPDAKSIKLACMQRLKIERPKLTRENELKYREAVKAYKENDFEKAYILTSEVLRTQDFEEVRKLNKKADLKRRNQ